MDASFLTFDKPGLYPEAVLVLGSNEMDLISVEAAGLQGEVAENLVPTAEYIVLNGIQAAAYNKGRAEVALDERRNDSFTVTLDSDNGSEILKSRTRDIPLVESQQ